MNVREDFESDSANAPAVETWLWLAQRISAVVLAVMIVTHLGTVIYAVRGGLTAAEIIARVGGSMGWAVFYGVFVTAVAVHAPIGLRAIIKEMTALPQTRVDLLCFMAAVLIGYLGYRVVGEFYRLGAIS